MDKMVHADQFTRFYRGVSYARSRARNGSTPEKDIENYLSKRVKDEGGMCVKFPPIFLAGFPDRIVLLPKGVLAFVELKANRKRARKVQLRIHDKLRGLGFRVEVIDSKEGVDELITELCYL